MTRDFGWDRSASLYLQLYERLLGVERPVFSAPRRASERLADQDEPRGRAVTCDYSL